MYSKAELSVLATLRDESTVTELATALDRSQNYVSELINRMESNGLVHTTRSGKTKRISRSNTKAIELFDTFCQRNSHIPFPELVAGSTLRILYYLAKPRSVSELATRVGVHRSTVHRSLTPLQSRGIVYQTNGKYTLNDEFIELATMATEFAHHRNRNRIETQTTAYTILWESLEEFLVQTEAEIDDGSFILTGPERFQAYGLPLLARQRRYYLYTASKVEISAAELCCHMLIIDGGTRSQSYCLLLLCTIDIDREDLRSMATTYGVEERVTDLLAYLDTTGAERTDTLPTWKEFCDLAAEYGVDV